ncbi:MAG TPA: peptide ABC transporter substrate-binding protein [Polyangia bacterium]|nr:peptide ABC transporter substrate-binding protein [Polyangia bacterium]
MASALLLAAIVCAGGGCRHKKPPAAGSKVAATPDFAPLRPPPPPAETLPAPAEVPPPARRGGSLRVHLDAEPSTLLPLVESDASTAQITNGLVYETLLDCRDGTYRPGLADSWDVSNDGMRIAVRVRGGVHWHDHRAFGVMDVQATVEPLLRNGNDAPVLRAELADVASIELVTERTVRFVLKRPSDLALRALCDVPILPDHLVRDVRPESSFIARSPVGTGPYRFGGWERGKRIRLERAPEYWGPAGGVDEIVFDLDADAVRALNRTRRGEIDILSRVIDAHYPDQVEPTTLHGASKLLRLRSRRYSFLAVNHQRYPLADPRFRRALAALWDRTRFAGELHNDLALPIGGPPLTEDIPAPQFDRKRAAAALDDAGYRDTDADGVRDHLGHPIRVSLLEPSGNKLFHVEAHAFALEARKAGVLVDLIPADAATILQRLKRGEFDLAPLIWEGAPDENPEPLYGAGGAFNYGGYRSTALDALIDEARLASGPAARAPVLSRIARLLADDQPVIFLYRYDVPALQSVRVHGLAAVGDRFDLQRVWLDP